MSRSIRHYIDIVQKAAALRETKSLLKAIPDDLYHGTSVERALDIMETGSIQGYPDRGTGEDMGVSTSTDFFVADDFATRTERDDSGEDYGVVFVLNGPALRRDGYDLVGYVSHPKAVAEKEVRILGPEVPAKYLTGMYYGRGFSYPTEISDRLRRVLESRSAGNEPESPP
jgi:hypothetical protein